MTEEKLAEQEDVPPSRLAWLPRGLIQSRLVLGLVILGEGFVKLDPSGLFQAVVLVLGVATDVFDGVAARKLKISTENLRKLDSRVDIAFFLLSVAGLLVFRPGLAGPVVLLGALLALLELAVHTISFIRFRKESSTHHYLSKFFSLFLFCLLGQFFLLPEVTWLYWLTMGLGVVSFVESGLIMLTIPRWRMDIRSWWDVLKERRP